MAAQWGFLTVRDMHAELNKRIFQTARTWKRLDLFWLHSTCSTEQKLQVYNAVITSKLLYGLETAQLTPS